MTSWALWCIAAWLIYHRLMEFFNTYDDLHSHYPLRCVPVCGEKELVDHTCTFTGTGPLPNWLVRFILPVHREICAPKTHVSGPKRESSTHRTIQEANTCHISSFPSEWSADLIENRNNAKPLMSLIELGCLDMLYHPDCLVSQAQLWRVSRRSGLQLDPRPSSIRMLLKLRTTWLESAPWWQRWWYQRAH